MNKQAERNARGEDFQQELRRSWTLIPGWRLRIKDGRGSSKPGDEIITLPTANLLIEAKRKSMPYLQLSDLRPNQLYGLRDFTKALPQNEGIVAVSILNDKLDECYLLPVRAMIETMKETGKLSIGRETLKAIALEVPRTTINGLPGYDLSNVENWLKERRKRN